MHSCDSIQLHNSHIWSKDNIANKNSDKVFDIGMGSFRGAETYELVELSIFNQLKTIFTGNTNIGLFRHNGFALISKRSNRNTHKTHEK